MFHDHSHRSEQLATLAAQVRVADEATPEMFSEIVGQTCQRPSAPNKAANAERLHQLIEAGALTQGALALIELELPQWKLRRITYDEGEWHCAMSRQRELPEWLAGPGDRGQPCKSYACGCGGLHRNASAGRSVEGAQPAVSAAGTVRSIRAAVLGKLC